MIEFNGINYLAVLVVWVITIIIGAVWYSPIGLGKQWSRLSGVDMMKTPKNEANRAIVFVAVSSLLQVLTLAVVLNSLDSSSLQNGMVATLVLWFGFVAISTIGNTLYQRQSLAFWWLNASYFLVVMLIGGFILSSWV